MTIDAATSEMVERTNYLAFGATESDFRPQRWNQFREDYKFTGKEEDIEVGLTYFGARYYQPYLGRFASPDPLTVHGLGSDLNPYAYVRGRVTTSVDPFGLGENDIYTDGGPNPNNPNPDETQEVVVHGAPRVAEIAGQIALAPWVALGRALGVVGGGSARPKAPAPPTAAGPPSFVGAAKGTLDTAAGIAAAGRDEYVQSLLIYSTPAGFALANFGAFNWAMTQTQPGAMHQAYFLGRFGLAIASLAAGEGGSPTSLVGATDGAAAQMLVASGGEDIQAATVLREISKGEKIADLVSEVSSLRDATNVEYAVVSRTDGSRALVYGGTDGIDFADFPLRRILGHSHPLGYPTPSIADFEILQALGQRSSWLLESKLIRFGVRPAP